MYKQYIIYLTDSIYTSTILAENAVAPNVATNSVDSFNDTTAGVAMGQSVFQVCVFSKIHEKK